jgi:hypothetical protein
MSGRRDAWQMRRAGLIDEEALRRRAVPDALALGVEPALVELLELEVDAVLLRYGSSDAGAPPTA